MPSQQPIPVTIVAGFLGSGKTTLLNHLLRSANGLRIGVVVNDFGKIGIDALTVAGQVDSMVSLGNGCLCCAVDGSELDEMLATLARPANRIDVIVIEASGLAEPETIVRMVLGSASDLIGYGGLVEVVDAAEFDRTRAAHPSLDRHLRLADLVVLNKTDRVAAGALADTAATVGRLAEGAPVLRTTHARVDPALLFEIGTRPADLVGQQLSLDMLVAEHDDDHEGHAHAAYESVEFESDEPMHPDRLLAFLDNAPAGLYRIKGFVYFGVPGHRQRFTLHVVGRYLRFERSRWPRGEARTTQLVLIGAGIDAGAILADLAACREPVPDSISPDRMLSVLRYLRD